MSATNVQDEMNSNDKLVSDEAASLELPPVVTRTRSGRRVRTPSALLDSEVTTKPPVRRTRKSVIQEVPVTSETEETAECQAVVTKSCVEPGESKSIPIINTPEVEATEQVALGFTKEFIISEAALSTDVPMDKISPDNSVGMRSDKSNENENRANLNVTLDIWTRTNEKSKKRTHSESSVKHAPIIPLGKPKSGRVWKDRNKQRFSALLRDKPLCTSWEKKMEARREKDLVKKYHLQLREGSAKEKQDKRKRREETLKRRAENERKSEIVQVIRNTSKIKRMKKKQLRKIEKRDTLPMLQKSKPSNGKLAGKTQKGD
ncbi:coiled-coil domain-containing protein 86 [Clupea harengus]|uniref:Coiled-coil domain-containing protein 86 n=1 Tax=Clupea harengus TaxID=7950 RepID=A0A6P8EU96_CLUHA|nr:coiled-coil domain-containing protein 86 [Clupea harengus]